MHVGLLSMKSFFSLEEEGSTHTGREVERERERERINKITEEVMSNGIEQIILEF